MHELKSPSKIMFSYFDESESILLERQSRCDSILLLLDCKNNSIDIFSFQSLIHHKNFQKDFFCSNDSGRNIAPNKQHNTTIISILI